MKKTFNINIGGYVFTIDDDAYTLLDNYLTTLRHAFGSEQDGTEIVNDIEIRISELFQELTTNGQIVITLSDVENVINRIGKPEDILQTEVSESIDAEGDVVEEVTVKHTATPPPYHEPVKRKFFRDPRHSQLGGVCAGIAAYLDVDVVWVRLLAVASIFVSCSITILAYIILWIVVPPAITPLEQMQMTGKEPTIENIGQTVTESFSQNEGTSPRESSQANGVAGGVSNFLSVLAKIGIIIFLIIAFPVLISIGIGFVGCMIALVIFLVAGFNGFGESSWWAGELLTDQYSTVIYGLLCAIGWMLVLGVPLFCAVRALTFGKNSQTSPAWKWSVVTVWILGFLLAGVFTGMLIKSDTVRRDIFPMDRMELLDDDMLEQLEKVDKIRHSRHGRNKSGIYQIETEVTTPTDTVINEVKLDSNGYVID